MDRMISGLIRLGKGFGVMALILFIFFCFGGLVTLCLQYAWVNLVWSVPLIFGLAWALGEDF